MNYKLQELTGTIIYITELSVHMWGLWWACLVGGLIS